jgi:hypothetical protein
LSADDDKQPADTRPRDQQEKDLTCKAKEGSPHSDLSNPVTDPDPTEWPDPYDKREDPRGPESSDPAPGPSTSEPPPDRNVDDMRREERGDNSGS